ncbi:MULTISPECIES: ABC transporter substrate-binding protein [Paenibacillus]|uniref:ABC transporter substrate-binding protein n=1 Tax=Paenibacillus TaxID=44249 RepID=UPI0004BA1890|nr:MULTISPECIES: ABC transporter substrate-binding protein [Paenibacillus]MDU0332755.1 ABC transporter substrate-binding protein [Paenibacillus sp. 3LSP]MEC2344478.1 ABC transporter substrate-binding protein [Paenibacillus barengoltzii]SMF29360.1 DNA-binding transcriptional regulator SgrR of sgrS sRNA, contains a MarR-type HTH domain and a solute-binding domain [Paenibacillus barengoltzii]
MEVCMVVLTAERYLALLNHYAEGIGDSAEPREVEVALEDLTKLFHCTERNAKLVIRKLQEEGLIDWSPGRGRGHRSRLVFRVNRENFLIDLAQRLAEKGEYRLAFEFLHQHEGDIHARERFIQWLNDQFGAERQLAAGQSCRDIFRLPVYKAPFTLDPAKLIYDLDSHLVRQIFDRLVQYDQTIGQVTGMIAHHWDHDETGTVWTFHLRKGVRFHHGKELTAEDVVFTFSRLREVSTNRWLVSSIDQIEALDTRTVLFRLHQPNWLLPRLFCSSCASILPADLLGKDETAFWQFPSGTGPFRLTHWSLNRMELEVHAGYFLGRPYLDGVTLVFLPDDIPNSSKLRWEQLIVNDSRVPTKAGDDWNRIQTLRRGCSLISWNRNRLGPQQSLAFRQAINLAIDRPGLIQATGKSGYPARSFQPTEDTILGVHRHDPAAARQLLEAHGYNGVPIRLAAHHLDREEAEWIQAQCETIGIPVEIVKYEKGDMARTAALEADAVLLCLVFAEDEVCELESFLQEDSYIRLHMPPELSRWVFSMVDEVFASRSPEKRRVLLQQIEYRLQDEAQVTFLVHSMLNTYVHPSIRGVAINNLGWMDFKDIWLTSASSAG